MDRPIQITCNSEGATFLYENGTVCMYTDEKFSTSVPYVQPDPEDAVVHIASNAVNTLILTRNGNLYKYVLIFSLCNFY